MLLLVLAAGCGPGQAAPTGEPSGQESQATEAPAAAVTLVVYSGRSEELVAPILERFEEAQGLDLQVRYGDTAELAATLLEEGQNSPAAVYYAQDAGALGAVARAGLFQKLSEDILDRVPARLRSKDGEWVPLSARARVIAYNKDLVPAEELPASVRELTDPKWQGQVGWAPANGSFQAFVTALRLLWGEEETRAWLEGMVVNGVQEYPKNTPIRDAVAAGEIKLGLINHYYVARAYAEQGTTYPVGLHYPSNDPGSLINVAGMGVLKTAGESTEAALELVGFLLSEEGQRYFTQETKEYPVTGDVQPPEGLIPLDQIQTPEIDLNDLEDLEGTLELLEETGVL